jgi:thioredoxin reductase (NADPH)
MSIRRTLASALSGYGVAGGVTVAEVSLPVLVAVDDNADLLRDIERELRDRYARHYRIECVGSDAAEACLEDLASAGEQVALILAGQRLAGRSGAELLGEVRRIHPHAKRVLLVGWSEQGNPATSEAIAHGGIDHYLVRPSAPPDELFHSGVSSFLLDWANARRTAPHTVHIIGESWSGRAYELREVLGRCALPHSFCLADSPEGRGLLATAGTEPRLPLLLFPDGTVLSNPSDMDVARAAGTTIDPQGLDFELVIVGGGPAGLSAAVYGASEGLRTLVIDSGGVGGQATSSSSIRNYLGFPRGVSGGALARRAYEQAMVFGAQFAFMQTVTHLRRDGDSLILDLSHGGRVTARAVILAMGARYRRLGIPALEELVGAGVYYGAAASEAQMTAGRDVYIVGGANSAGQAAVYLAQYARRVSVLVRAATLSAGMSHYLVRQIEATPNVRVLTSTEIVDGGGDGWLDHLVLRDHKQGPELETVPADALFLLIGAHPHTSWLPPQIERDADGFIVTGADLRPDQARALGRAPYAFETSMPGVLAVGDVRYGSVRRVASAVGGGSIAIQVVHRLLAAREPGGDAAARHEADITIATVGPA